LATLVLNSMDHISPYFNIFRSESFIISIIDIDWSKFFEAAILFAHHIWSHWIFSHLSSEVLMVDIILRIYVVMDDKESKIRLISLLGIDTMLWLIMLSDYSFLDGLENKFCLVSIFWILNRVISFKNSFFKKFFWLGEYLIEDYSLIRTDILFFLFVAI
jgi:hypothetical protein